MSVIRTDLADPTLRYQHIYLAPHLDDAVLSCGGAIAAHAADGQPVLIATLCAGAPPPDAPLSDFAVEMHRRWGLSAADVLDVRRREDTAALEWLSVDGYHFDFLDAIYRLPAAYATEELLFGAVAVDDPLTTACRDALTTLRQRFPDAAFYAPLGVGQHVDHQIVYSAARELATAGYTVAFYEDFPYVARQGAVEQRLEALGGATRFVASFVRIDYTLARKIGAIELYTSQIANLFGDANSMARAVTSYARNLHNAGSFHGERLWLGGELLLADGG